MTENPTYPTIVRDFRSSFVGADLIVLTAGFEDRALQVLKLGDFNEKSHCIIIRFRNEVPGNDVVFGRFLSIANSKFPSDRLHVVELLGHQTDLFSRSLNDLIGKLSRELRSFALDISGMPAYLICLSLKIIRDHRPKDVHSVFYTAAEEYNPSFSEYEALTGDGKDEIDLLPRSMALEMSDNLVLDAFSGYRSHDGKSCLVVFAGYEVHRTTGIVDEVNPSILLLIYGRPGNPVLDWRLDLSQRLHKKFERGRRTGTEIISTLDVQGSVDILETYYGFLIDDYDLVIAPICSKMHSVAAFLFWEKYGEVRLSFPQPIGYDPRNAPVGAGLTYHYKLEERNVLYRGLSEAPS